jgi:hypothetical protein
LVDDKILAVVLNQGLINLISTDENQLGSFIVRNKGIAIHQINNFSSYIETMQKSLNENNFKG